MMRFRAWNSPAPIADAPLPIVTPYRVLFSTHTFSQSSAQQNSPVPPAMMPSYWKFVVTSDSDMSLAERLVALHEGLSGVIETHRPDVAAVEQTFVNKDPVATLKLGQARAIALLVPAQRGLPVAEYAPNQVKKSVVGVGHAEKEQVHAMVKVLLPHSTAKGPDAADALAVAITHAHMSESADRIASLMARAR